MDETKCYFYSSSTTTNEDGEEVTTKYRSGYGNFTDENGEKKYYVVGNDGNPVYTDENTYMNEIKKQDEVLRSHNFAPLPLESYTTQQSFFPQPQLIQQHFPIPNMASLHNNPYLPLPLQFRTHDYRDDEIEALRRENQELRNHIRYNPLRNPFM